MANTTESTAAKAALVGHSEATIDEKGRIHIAKKNRDVLGENFAMMIGTVGCLEAVTGEAFNKLYDEIVDAGPINPYAKRLSRDLLGHSETGCNFDKQGRVVVPKQLRDKAGLKERIVLVGCGQRLEIWDAEEYANYEQNEDEYGKERQDAILTAWTKMRDTA